MCRAFLQQRKYRLTTLESNDVMNCIGSIHDKLNAANLLCDMQPVDAGSAFVGEFLSASTVLCVYLGTWTSGGTKWEIIACVLGFAYLFRKSLIKQIIAMFNP
jgi:hypothetical protein